MKSLPNSTSGVILLSDPFTTSIFTLTCYQTTKELKVSGMIGHGISVHDSIFAYPFIRHLRQCAPDLPGLGLERVVLDASL